MYQENNQKSWSTILIIGTVEFTEFQSTCYWKDIRINGSRKKTLEIPGNKDAQKEIRKQETLKRAHAGAAWLGCCHSCHCCHHLCYCYCEDSDPQNSLITCCTHCPESQEGTHIKLTELVSQAIHSCQKRFVGRFGFHGGHRHQKVVSGQNDAQWNSQEREFTESKLGGLYEE